MRQRGKYMRVYWSGAAFWLQADLRLREAGQTLDQVLDRFAQCHLPAPDRWAPSRLLRRLDQLAGRRVFEPLYQDMIDQRRFPDLGPAYAALGLEVRGSRLRLAGEENAEALRNQLSTPTARRTQVACASGSD